RLARFEHRFGSRARGFGRGRVRKGDPPHQRGSPRRIHRSLARNRVNGFPCRRQLPAGQALTGFRSGVGAMARIVSDLDPAVQFVFRAGRRLHTARRQVERGQFTPGFTDGNLANAERIMLNLVLGGARSGKSRYAQSLCKSSTHVIYIATAHSGAGTDDHEMRERIARHRADRPTEWQTVEEPLDLSRAVREAPVEAILLIDCITLWISNLMWEFREKPAAEQE